jgi:hypothetical protein
MADKKDKIELSTAKFKLFQAAFNKDKSKTRDQMKKRRELEADKRQLEKERNDE